MPSYSYAYEKLLGAIEIMATSKGARPYRLELATISYILRLTPKNVPEEIRGELQEFMSGMTSKKDPYGYLGHIGWTARQMHWKTAERLSKQLFSMFLIVTEYKQKSKHKDHWGSS